MLQAIISPGHRLSPQIPSRFPTQPSRPPILHAAIQTQRHRCAWRHPANPPVPLTGNVSHSRISAAGSSARVADTDQIESQNSTSASQGTTASGSEGPSFSSNRPSNGSASDLRSNSMGYGGNGRGGGAPQYEMLQEQDFGKFVSFFRGASPYIEGHRGRTFVIVIPGEVVCREELLYPVLEDVALLSGLGVRLVLVLGARPNIDAMVRQSGAEPQYAAGQRVTDARTMQAAMQAAGAARMQVEGRLSKGPAVTMVRRHNRGSDRFHYGPALQTVSGNYVAAKRRGVVDGIDYGFTGTVRFVQVDSVKRQLDAGSVVLLSNLGFSAAGEVLNCDIYTVATRAAIDLGADKLICMTLPETQPIALPLWTPLSDAERVLSALVADREPTDGPSSIPKVVRKADDRLSMTSGSLSSTDSGAGSDDAELDFDKWQAFGLPLPLMAACAACEGGVKRTHLLDAATEGALLLELYSRDGIGAMISTDFYEGIRDAVPSDLDGVAALLAPLEDAGILKPRSREALLAELKWYTVLEREGKLLGCAMLQPLERGSDGIKSAELAAFCVHPSYRGSGRGDSLLDFLERKAANSGTGRVVLMTTRTADWFEQRGFQPAGAAHSSSLLPASRRDKVDASRGSLLYVKEVKSIASIAIASMVQATR